MNSFNYFGENLLLNYLINFNYFTKLYIIYLYHLLCDNMLYELAEEAKREISKYCDDYEIFLENTELLQ